MVVVEFWLGLVREMDTHLDTRGSHNAGKLLLRLRIKQGLECSQLKAVLEVLQDTSVTCGCPPQSCREGFGEYLEEFEFPEVPRGTSPGGVGCTV